MDVGTFNALVNLLALVYGADAAARDARLDDMINRLDTLQKGLNSMSDALSKLQDAGTSAEQKMDAAVEVMTNAGKMLSDVAGRITSAGVDPQKLNQIATDLTQHSAGLDTATNALKTAMQPASSSPPPPPPVSSSDPAEAAAQADTPAAAKTI